MKNIHITLTEFRNESRVLKEISSLEAAETFSTFSVIALGADDLATRESISPKARVERIRLRSRGLPKSSLYQLIKFIEFMLKCFLMVKREKANVVNVHTLALLPLGWVLKKSLHVKLVYDAHELETEIYETKSIRKTIAKTIERIFISKADLIFVVSESIADWYAGTYQIDRPTVIKNAPGLRQQNKQDLFRETLGILPEQKILLYQGGLMKGRGVQLILEGFKARTSSDVVAVFMGYGGLATEIEKAAKTHANIFYMPAVPPNVVLDYTSSADMGIHLIQNTCLNHYYCLPNKFFEYAMAGLPVIVSDMKEMADAVQQADFGEVLSEYSTAAINAAVDRLASRDLSQLSENAYQFAQTHSWEKQEIKMIDEYKRILDAK